MIAMPTIQTAQGPVEAEELGTTLIHEHVRFRDEAVAEQWPARYDREAELAAALDHVNAAAAHGVEAIVDPTAMFGGRDVEFMRRVAQESGVKIVACTGIYTYDYLPPYFANRSEDQMAEHFVEDIEKGVQGTDIRAGFLKCAADEPGVTPSIEKVHRAVARASVQTGAPIMAHSRPASDTGPRQLEIFAEAGVDSEKVQIAHTGDTGDLDYIEGILDSGAYIGLDRYGLDMFLSLERRNATAAELLRRGYAEKVFISQDFCATIDWFPPEALGGLIEGGLVPPTLREEGAFTDQHFEQIFRQTPRRWLAG